MIRQSPDINTDISMIWMVTSWPVSQDYGASLQLYTLQTLAHGEIVRSDTEAWKMEIIEIKYCSFWWSS
jgi:hypothetical protein